jgi:hypothetical protein
MKKFLQLLLLSLGFIGSANANANSIEGAFGYKLGEELKEEIEIKFNYGRFISWKSFTPQKPLPDFEKYGIYTTLSDKKIYKIVAINSNYDGNSCGFSLDPKGGFTYIRNLLEAKYGDASSQKLNDDKYNYIYWREENYFNRSITLLCSYENLNRPDLMLEYLDEDLESRASSESNEMVQQKLLDESSKYDL